MWDDGETFVVIEHDIEIREGTLDSLTQCDEEWCAFPYAMGPSGYMTALGCTKFDAQLMREIPSFMSQVSDQVDPWSPPRDWRRLDRRIFVVLTELHGKTEHRHEPHVLHHNAEKRVPVELESDS